MELVLKVNDVAVGWIALVVLGVWVAAALYAALTR